MRDFINIVEILSEATTRDDREITFKREENIDRRNRGFILDQITAYVDGQEAGYIKIENIPGRLFRQFYPGIFNYMDQIGGKSLFPDDKEHVRYQTLDDKELIKLLCNTGDHYTYSPSEFSGLTRRELLDRIAHVEKQWLAGRYGQQFREFRKFHVDKPFVAFIRVEPEFQRLYIATALYQEAARWMKERGYVFRSSRLQSDEAKAAWQKISKTEKVRKDRHGRYMLYPSEQTISENLNTDVFREGLCYALAYTLNNRFGWQIAVMASEDEELHTIHGFVILPNGIGLDIDGPRPVDQIIDEYADGEEGWRVVKLSPRELLSILNPSIRPTPNDLRQANEAISYMEERWPKVFNQ